MFLNKSLKHVPLRNLRQPLFSTLRPSLASAQTRPYFSVFEKVKERFSTPMKHIQSFVQPDGYAS